MSKYRWGLGGEYQFLEQEIRQLQKEVCEMERKIERLDDNASLNSKDRQIDLLMKRQENLESLIEKSNERRYEIEDMIEELPAKYRVILRMRYIEDMTIYAVASKMGYGVDWVKRNCSKGLKMLKERETK